jgi:Uma2 family endonuclease
MMTAEKLASKVQWTEAQYLEFERASQEKHEFLHGEIYAMTGGSNNHSVITLNTGSHIHMQIRGGSCRTYDSNMRIRVSTKGNYTYPDVSVVCGQPMFLDDKKDTLLNPTLIVEVLSPSTERYDRGAKFRHYQSIDFFRQYVLIVQDAPQIECYTRDDDGKWIYTVAIGLDSTIELTAIGCTLALKDVYENIVFEENMLEHE